MEKQTKRQLRSLDGLSVLFIGNSFIYYGNCVADKSRDNDEGYFFQLARSNNERVRVYNYTYGGKNLKYIYENHLQHESADFFPQFDIVFLSEAGENNANIIRDIKNIMALFPKKTEFCYLCHEYTHFASHENVLSAFGRMREMGLRIADWGGLVTRIWKGEVSVPFSETYYIRQTFFKSNKGATNGDFPVGAGRPGDEYHQNPLSGYICALLAYCTVSGRQAYGAEFKFATDKSVHPLFDTEAFVRSHYNNGVGTNMNEVLSSETEMRGIQMLIDEVVE